MPFIEALSDDDAGDEARQHFDADRERLGFVANNTRLLARRPAAYAAWRQLVGAVSEGMDPRRYELATFAPARALSSSYCLLAHGKVVLDRFYEADELRAIVEDHRSAGLDAADVAVMDLAEQVAVDATQVTQDDVDALLRLGLSEEEVLDVVLAAAARCFFSKALDAVGAEADASYRALDPVLREALTPGRPIAAG